MSELKVVSKLNNKNIIPEDKVDKNSDKYKVIFKIR